MDQLTSNVYSPSGRIGSAFFVVPPIAIVGVVLLSIVYAYVDVYCPIAGYISFLFVLLFALGLGKTMSFAARLAKCRHSGIMYSFGLLFGVLAIYVSWAVFEYALLKRTGEASELTLLKIVQSPKTVWNIAAILNHTGWYSIKDVTIKGGILWVFWGVEALIVLLAVFFSATYVMRECVFCESCNQWCDPKNSSKTFSVSEKAAIEKQVSEGQNNLDLNMKLANQQDNPVIMAKTWTCTSCSDTAAIQWQQATAKVDKSGKKSISTESLTPIHNVDSHAIQKLHSAGQSQ